MTRRELNPIRHVARLFQGVVGIWHQLDEERFEPSGSGKKGDPLLVAYIFSIATASIVLQEYIGTTSFFLGILEFIDKTNHPEASPFWYWVFEWIRPREGTVQSWIVRTGYYELIALCYWAAWRVLGFLVIPMLAVWVHPTLRKRPLGLSAKGMRQHLWVYGLLFLPVLGAVIVVSYFESFQEYYPFYSRAHHSLLEFFIWEGFYVAQFISLEFFFRGFMIQPLRRELGSGAIFAMMIPYVMIHIGKPMIECFAAIIAGIVLGTLAMRTRSIWSGVLIHVGVALSMDLLSIWQKIR